ncbi:hypothetical protein AVEN_245671-1 [Araneus ventricosus]|uniref:Uncharacterized protein n=1 Tax=Araneus ventricosus TaxID=182803 RepID=A0A4Y2PA91_ARAVE|nr:hypothetical protein AVEN_245671-1 [Araneus ventricosus]
MFISTYYFSLGYFPTNSRIIFKRVLAEDACSGLVEKFKRPVTSLVGRGDATRSYGQAEAQRKNEKRTEEKTKKTETKEEMDISELKESLQPLREVQTLIQEFPTLLEAAKLCRKAKTKQEKILIVLNALVQE